MRFIDLHVHSDYSDGTLPPAQVVALAAAKRLKAIALTDHDTVNGIDEAALAAEDTCVELVPGVELSCNYKEKEIHMLGLYIDPHSEELKAALEQFRTVRQKRNYAIKNLFEADGICFTMEELTGGNPDLVVTRAHFARLLLNKGYVSSMEQAFKRYLGDGCKYYIPKEAFEVEKAIRLILLAGGLPVVAHPIQYKLGWKETERMIAEFKEMGLGGIEVYYSSHRPNESEMLRRLCNTYRLLPTGGSDFHGKNKPDIELGTGRGGLRVTEGLLKDIKESLFKGKQALLETESSLFY